MFNRRTVLISLAILFAATLLFGSYLLAQAQTSTPTGTITVDSTADDGSGGCTLREAIAAANTDSASGDCAAGSGADTIVFALSGSDAYTITLNGTQLPIIDDTLTIDGSTAGDLTISGDNASRIFEIGSGTAVTMTQLTIAFGNADYGAGILNGDAVSTSGGTLVLRDGTLTSNEATLSGGGIYNVFSGTVTVMDSTFSGNSADTSGGGIFSNGGTATVMDSTLSGNSATYNGGGIFNGGSSTLTVSNSTLSDNSAGYGGGGIWNTGTVTVTNSTLSGNAADSIAGGIFNGDTLTVTNSTLSGNAAEYDGGGIYNGDTLTVANSTLSGNTAATTGSGIYNASDGVVLMTNSMAANSPLGHDCWNDGTIVKFESNLVESGNCGDAITDDPRLEPLQNNGGPTLTHALLPGSPAIDAGDAGACETADQRGAPRPQGEGCDIGAFEAQPVIYLPLLQVDDVASGTTSREAGLR